MRWIYIPARLRFLFLEFYDFSLKDFYLVKECTSIMKIIIEEELCKQHVNFNGRFFIQLYTFKIKFFAFLNIILL